MLNLLKALVILTLLALIGGGGYGAYYWLWAAPKLRDAQEKAQFQAQAAERPPDPSTPEFERAQALKRDRNYPDARAALEAFIIRYPDSSHYDQALGLLGDMNYSELMDGRLGAGKTEYIVQRGDVLDRVAHKVKSDPELIYQANSLDRIMLRIGQKLVIPDVDFALEAHLNPKRLVVRNHGKFFKSYVLQDARPLGKKVPEIRTKVQQKNATLNGRSVVFGSKDFVNSLRSLTLAGQPGYTIYAINDAESDGSKPAGSGLGLVASDAEEVHALVSVGTPVVVTAK